MRGPARSGFTAAHLGRPCRDRVPGRVVAVGWDGEAVFDAYIRPEAAVRSCLTPLTGPGCAPRRAVTAVPLTRSPIAGIEEEHLIGAASLEDVRAAMLKALPARPILLGWSVHHGAIIALPCPVLRPQVPPLPYRPYADVHWLGLKVPQSPQPRSSVSPSPHRPRAARRAPRRGDRRVAHVSSAEARHQVETGRRVSLLLAAPRACRAAQGAAPPPAGAHAAHLQALLHPRDPPSAGGRACASFSQAKSEAQGASAQRSGHGCIAVYCRGVIAFFCRCNQCIDERRRQHMCRAVLRCIVDGEHSARPCMGCTRRLAAVQGFSRSDACGSEAGRCSTRSEATRGQDPAPDVPRRDRRGVVVSA